MLAARPSFALLGLCLACAGPPELLVWQAPAGIEAVAKATGAVRQLPDYARPGLGQGTAPTEFTSEVTAEDLRSGRTTVLWVDVREDVIATHIGHDAPWRTSRELQLNQPAYEVAAPAAELVQISKRLGAGNPPALIAAAPDASAVQVLATARALWSAGVQTHALVSPTGRLEFVGQDPKIQVLVLADEALETCRTEVAPDASWADAAAALSGSFCAAQSLSIRAEHPLEEP